ncbi:hypothetical protein [Halostella litorea]|uniref:hypothetical protein n=1 Tax=Halostella litorea TaxID=2528831 RepID=UPI0013868C2E|nr:hypothetical protein [Halostella litorea]
MAGICEHRDRPQRGEAGRDARVVSEHFAGDHEGDTDGRQADGGEAVEAGRRDQPLGDRVGLDASPVADVDERQHGDCRGRQQGHVLEWLEPMLLLGGIVCGHE